MLRSVLQFVRRNKPQSRPPIPSRETPLPLFLPLSELDQIAEMVQAIADLDPFYQRGIPCWMSTDISVRELLMHGERN